MSWRKENRRRRQRERPFARRVGYETVKEGGGTILQQIGAALGALAGLLATRWGAPPTAAVITGSVVGSTIGAVGKGFVAATLDQMREQRENRAANRSTRAGGAGVRRSAGHLPGMRGGASRVSGPSGRGGGSSSASTFSQVISGLEKVIDQLDRAAKQTHQLGIDVWASHNALSATLAGGRPEVVRHAHDRMTTTRHHVQDAASLLRQASESLREYRSAI